jgi:hypothetical protein
MAEFDGDSNATPLSKLAPPQATNTPGQGRQLPMTAGGGMAGGGPPSYADAMRQAQTQAAQAAVQPMPPPMMQDTAHGGQHMAQHPGGGQHMAQHPGGGQHMYDAYDDADDDEYMPPPPPRHRQQQRRPAAAATAQDSSSDDDDEYTPRRRPRRGAAKTSSATSKWLDWRQYKPGLLVAAVVLVMLVYGVPRLKQFVPQLATPTGRLSYAGLAVVSLLTGAVFQASSKVVLR